jgi:hypothetical protein
VVFWWFGKLSYGFVASEGDFYVCVLEQIGDPTYVRGGEGEGCPLCYFRLCERCSVYYFVLDLVL